MKRLFTIAVILMATSLTFAQAPQAKRSAASVNKLERVADLKAMAKKAKETKELQAAMAEKAAVAKETSSSALRKGSVNSGLKSMEGTVIKIGMLGNDRREVSNKPYKSNARKTTTQEGNVTVTADANGIITDVTGVEPKMYQRAATGTAYYVSGQQMGAGTQSGMVTIVEDGDNVYIKNPVTRYAADSWVKGTKNGNSIIVAAHQPLNYSTQYNATVSLRWGAITTAGNIVVADDHAENFIFTVDGDVLTLEGTIAYESGLTSDAFYMGVFWDDNNSNSGYGDAETVLTYDPNYVAPSTELVTPPAGIEATGWYMNGISKTSKGETAIKNQAVNVAFVGNDVYVQGLTAYFPTAWIKGTIDGANIKFDKFQYVGSYMGSNDCWFTGVDPSSEELKDATATYDAAAKTISFVDDILINASTDRVYYLDWFVNVVISAEEQVYVEPTITDLTASLPYANTFETEEEQAQAAIYDANGDESTFTFEKHSDTESMTARYHYDFSNNADDYLVFPGVTLKAGVTYNVSLDAASYNANYPERLEVLAGKEAKASQLTIPVIAATDVATKEFIPISNKEFTVAEDGVYYIAVHAISDVNEFYLYVDNFSISELDMEAPAIVSDLAVVADAQGANKATVTFTVPSLTFGGAAITEEVKVTVKREGVDIYSETKAAGAAVSFIDEVEAAGTYTYSVTASYGEHVGEAAVVKTYIGYDTPDVVANVVSADKSGSVDLAWDAPAGGANGYVVNPADFKYNIYPVELVDFFGMTFPMTDYEHPYVTGLTETSANVEFDTNSGEHAFTYFAITAENTTGESDDAYAPVVTGAPYQMPVFESVAEGALSYWWGTATDSYNGALEGGLYIGSNASDGDGNCFQMVAETMGWINLQSGKIALAGTVNPTLTFDYAGGQAIPLTVSVITPKGESDVATFSTGTDYATATVSLVDFANEDWVRVIITGTFSAADSALIDNVRIYNKLDNNLVAGNITATTRVSAGEDVTVTVDVENQGSNVAEAGVYTVALYCNDAKVQSLPGTTLASNAKTTFTFTEATTVLSPAELVWKAVVEFAADEDQANNTTLTAKTAIKMNKYPVVTDLAAVQGAAGVELTWSEPNMDAGITETIVDDLEGYDSFSTIAGDWIFVDKDDAEVGGFQGMEIPNIPIQSKQSFFVFDAASDEFNEYFAAHSGTKYFAALFRYDDGQVDDWAISPVLSGAAQTISFFAKSYSTEYPEAIEILYSTGSINPDDFVSLSTVAPVPGEWTEYTAALPEGATRFAIRSMATSSFMLMIDDITYESGSTTADLALVGYNVYRDGVKITAEPVAEAEYVDTEATVGAHSYVVTVVYDKGESQISNVATIDVSGIGTIAAKKVNIAVADREIVVSNAAGCNISICTADGKTVYSAAGSNLARIRVESGVYIVKVGNAVTKTVVK